MPQFVIERNIPDAGSLSEVQIRDLAQRVRTTAQVNHVAPEALARARGERQRTILGLHDPAFYDG